MSVLNDHREGMVQERVGGIIAIHRVLGRGISLARGYGSRISGLLRPGRGGPVTSSCNQQVLRERPFAVDPLPVAPESRARRHLWNSFGSVLVRAFLPYCFVFVQHEPQARLRN